MGVYIKDMEMPTKYPVTVTIFPDGIPSDEETRFCAGCGADMRGEQDV